MTDPSPDPIRCVILRRIFLVAWLEFLLFMLVSLVMRGNAINGRIVDGIAYLGSHGIYRAVSMLTYRAMLAFETASILLFVTGLAAMLAHNLHRDCRARARDRLWPW